MFHISGLFLNLTFVLEEKLCKLVSISLFFQKKKHSYLYLIYFLPQLFLKIIYLYLFMIFYHFTILLFFPPFLPQPFLIKQLLGSKISFRKS